MTEPFWEKSYEDPHASTFGGPSQEICDVVSNLKSGAKILDVGCGEGRNAIYLAECGFNVTAVDISEAGINKLNKIAHKKNISIESKVADVRHFQFPHSYDMIIAHGCLHLMEREAWKQLISHFKKQTSPGGINIIVVITDEVSPPDHLSDFFIGLFREREIFSYYTDWDSILQRSYMFEDDRPGRPTHTHPVNKIVARKPLK